MLSDIANVPKWYILTYLGSHRDAEKKLAAIDLPSFAPLFFGQDSKNGNLQDYLHFANYAFIYGTQNQIYDYKLKVLRSFNFLRKNYGKEQTHPYVEAYVVEQLRKIEEINAGKIPFMPYPSDVIAGDTIRILTGQFKDQQATAIKKNGSKYRDIVLDIAGTFLIPLCKLRVGEYEIVKYSEDVSNIGSVKAKQEDFTFLHNALERYYGLKQADEGCLAQDTARVQEIAQHYRNALPGTLLQRVKISLLLVMAYTILEHNEEQVHYIKHSLNLIQEKCSSALKASVYCTLYGCTFNGEYYTRYIAARKEAQGTKDEKSFSKINEVMNLYSRWNNHLHSRQTKQSLRCDTNEAQWFAIELLSPMDEVLPHLKKENVATYIPDIKNQSGKPVLLAHSTFENLRKIQVKHSLFAFMRDIRDNHDVPLYFTATEVSDYRHVIETASEELQHLDLTPEYDAVFSKAKTVNISLHGRKVHGILGTTKIKRTEHRRIIIYLRHLAAIAIPYAE